VRDISNPPQSPFGKGGDYQKIVEPVPSETRNLIEIASPAPLFEIPL